MFREKTCVYIYSITNGIERIYKQSFYNSSSKFMKLRKAYTLRLKKWMAGIRKKMEYLKVLSWDLKYLFEDNKYIFIVDRTVALSMHSNKKIQVWAHMRPPPPFHKQWGQ